MSKAILEKADGVIIATPIYKAAYTGLLKTFLDLVEAVRRQSASDGRVYVELNRS